MNRYDVIKAYFRFLRESGLAAEEVVLSAGAAMVVLGHRNQTNDLDIDVPEWFFLQHKQSHNFRNCRHGNFVQYNPRISLQVNTLQLTDVRVTLTRLGGKIFTYSPLRLFEQKVFLLEQPNRNPTRLTRDVNDCEALMKVLAEQELTCKEVELFSRYFVAKCDLRWELV
jgi:hypothetical protein